MEKKTRETNSFPQLSKMKVFSKSLKRDDRQFSSTAKAPANASKRPRMSSMIHFEASEKQHQSFSKVLQNEISQRQTVHLFYIVQSLNNINGYIPGYI